MKKAIAGLIVAGLIGAGGYLFWPKGQGGAEVDPDPFGKEYSLETAEDFYVNSGDFESMAAGGQFFFGVADLPGGQAQDFVDVREKLIDRIVEEADSAAEDAERLSPDVIRLEAEVFALLDALTEAGKGDEESIDSWATNLLNTRTQFETHLASYRGWASVDEEHPLAKANASEMQAIHGQASAMALLQEIEFAYVAAAQILASAEREPGVVDSQAAELKAAVLEFDKKNAEFEAMAQSALYVDEGLLELERADLLFAQYTFDYIQEQSSSVEADLAKLEASEYATENDIQSARAVLSLVKGWSEELEGEARQDLAMLPPRRLHPETRVLPGAAYAQPMGGNYHAAVTGMRELANSTGATLSSAASAAGDATIATYNTVAPIVQGAREWTTWGLDMAGATVGAVSQVPVGMYAGNSAGGIWEDAKSHYQRVNRNWANGAPKDNTFRDARRMMEDMERWADESAAGMVEGRVGEGWTSWGAGKIAKGLAGIFTGMTKAVAALGDPSASNGELAEAGLELALSATGGAKFALKGNSVKGMAQGLKSTADDVMRFIKEGVDAKAATQQLAELRRLGWDLTDPRDIMANTAAIEGLEASIRAAGKAKLEIAKSLGSRLKDALSLAWTNIKDETASNFATRFEGALRDNITGVLASIGRLIGDGLGDALSSIGAELIEDVIQDAVRSWMGDTLSPEELAGTIDGSIKIDTFWARDNAGDGDCAGVTGEQIAAEIRGKTFPTKFVFAPDGQSGSGTLTISVQGDGASGPYTLEGDMLDATVSAEGNAVQIKGKFVKNDNDLTFEGTINSQTSDYGLEGTVTMGPKVLPSPGTTRLE